MTRTYNLGDLFEGAAEALGDQDAVVAGSATRPPVRLTYAEVDERANRVAHHLRSLGVGAGDRVGVHLTNVPEFMEITIGLFKLRAVPVNANFRYTVDELAYTFEDAEASAIVTEADLAGRAAEAAPSLPLLTVGDDYDAALAAAAPEPPDVPGRSGDDLYLLYTGGTTGMPKGVMWRHEDLFFGALAGNGTPRTGQARLDDPDDIGDFVRTGTGVTRRFPMCPLIHGGAQWVALTALLSGGTAQLWSDASFDAEAALRFAADEGTELLMIIGDAVGRPLAEVLEANPDLALPELRLITSSGAILSPDTRRRLLARLPDAKVIDRFGASETGGQGRVRRDAEDRLVLQASPHTKVLGDDMRPLEPGTGEPGLLAQAGPIPLGYWNDPDKTARTFPVVDGVRYAVPGDYATLEADGTIVVHGRGSQVINTGGEKVFAEEVEAAVKSHPAVFDSLVVGVPHERFGSSVCAVISLRPGADAPSADELGEHCRTTLAGYKVPRSVIVVDEVRRKVTGKGDYAWAKQAATPASA